MNEFKDGCSSVSPTIDIDCGPALVSQYDIKLYANAEYAKHLSTFKSTTGSGVIDIITQIANGKFAPNTIHCTRKTITAFYKAFKRRNRLARVKGMRKYISSSKTRHWYT